MNFVTPFAALAIAVSGLFAVNNPAEAGVVRGDIAGYQGVTAVDRVDVDTLYVPFPEGDGVVHVRCSTGDITFNGTLGRTAARSIARAWCY